MPAQVAKTVREDESIWNWPLAWMPIVSGCAMAGSNAHQAGIRVSAEWQAFVGRRLDEDVRLIRKLSTARAADEACRAWFQFWQKATEDYAAEFATIARVAADVVPNTIAADTSRDTDATNFTSRAA